jgi:hypothetical protein
MSIMGKITAGFKRTSVEFYKAVKRCEKMAGVVIESQEVIYPITVTYSYYHVSNCSRS